MLASVEHGARNRLATVFFYLNNVTEGGATNFPRAATSAHPRGGAQRLLDKSPRPTYGRRVAAARPPRDRRVAAIGPPVRDFRYIPSHTVTGPPVRDYFDCSNGLSVYPLEGKVPCDRHPAAIQPPFNRHPTAIQPPFNRHSTAIQLSC